MESATNLGDAAQVIETFQRAAGVLRGSPHRKGSTVRLPARGRLLATGDLHDNPAHLQKIIRLARLDQSTDHHLALHEVIHSDRLINGMDFSYRTFTRAAELVARYPGQVHVLLANHELAQLTGRGVMKSFGNSVELFNDGLEYAFDDRWQDVLEAMQRYIAAMPLALISASIGAATGGVFCAHSLPAPRMMKSFDMTALDRELLPEDYLPPTGPAHMMVWGRGHNPQQIQELGRAWNVKLFCLGHEHAEAGLEIRGLLRVEAGAGQHDQSGAWLVINSDHERGAALPIDLANPPTPEEAMLAAIPLSAIA